MNSKTKSKVIIVVNNLHVGGISSLIYDLIKNSGSGNYNYEIVNLGKENDADVVNKINSLQTPLHNINYQYEDGYSLIHYFKKAYFKKKFIQKNKIVIDQIINLKPDILHFHTLPHELLLGQEVNRVVNCKLVYTDHTCRISLSEVNSFAKFLIAFPFRQFYQSYNVICVAKSVENYLMEFKINRVIKSISLIVNKVEDSSRRIKYEEKAELKVVYVARISEGKGHNDLITAWKNLPPLGLHLYLIGPENPEMNVESLIKGSDLNNPITLTGARSDVKEFISNADIGVFPSYKEGLPLALLEKMQLGIPCIVSDIEELTSVVENDENGVVFKCGDQAELASKIILLAKNLEKRKFLGTNAAKLVKEKYISKVGGIDKEYEQFYDKLI